MDTGHTDPAAVADLNATIESFFEHLKATGYAQRTMKKKRSAVRAFERWVKRRHLTLDCLSDRQIVTKFLDRLHPARIYRLSLERVTLRLLKEFLKPANAVSEDLPGSGGLIERYRDFLRNTRGLAETSLLVYIPGIRDFLAYAAAEHESPREYDATLIRAFLLEHTLNRPPSHAHLLAAALRSFLRFLFCQGDIALDLSSAVPAVGGRTPSLPPRLSPEDLDCVLAGPDRTTAGGRRDHAILLLLARLGLRANEVVRMELGDIRWRAGEIVVRGKGRQLDRLPLLSDVGEALALCLQDDRGATPCRRVFLRLFAPRIGLAGPAAVGHIVRRAFAKVGLRRPGRTAAHVFRHCLATTMIQRGASLPEISEVLRHRALSSTEIYAQVSLEALREVARPWPTEDAG